MDDADQERLRLLEAILRQEREDKASLMKRYAPGSHDYFDGMNLASVAENLVADKLCRHPAVLLDDALIKRAYAAQQSLWDLYQILADRHSEAVNSKRERP